MISVFGSLVDEEEIQAVAACMRSQWMGFGKQVAAFEEKYRQKFGIAHFAMVDSGSNALYLAVKLLNLPPGAEVIVPTFTWVSCAQAVLLAGYKPVFADVDLHTMNITCQTIEAVINSRTAAIMVVHYAGLPVDMEPIMALGLPIIEDAAHAVCSTYHGQPCGAIGEVGIYSFDAVKNLTVGEGGGIVTRTADMLQRAKTLRYCGIGKSGFEAATADAASRNRWWEYQIAEPFIKMLPTNLAAAIGLVQLERIESLQQRRKKIWEVYQHELATIQQVICPVEPESHATHSYFTYCIRVPRRDELAKFLLQNGVYTTLRYHPLHLNRLYGQQHIHLPQAEQLNEEALSIPLHPRLSDEDVGKVVDLIHHFYKTDKSV